MLIVSISINLSLAQNLNLLTGNFLLMEYNKGWAEKKDMREEITLIREIEPIIYIKN